MLLTEMPDTSRFGRVEFAADGHVTAFIEKGQSPDPVGSTRASICSTGVY